jgi:hypothetical protein
VRGDDVSDIVVDSDQLDGLAGRLAQIKQVLQGTGQLSVDGDALGSSAVAGSLAAFAQSWSAGRAQLYEAIDRCHADLTAASRGYTALETTLAQGLAPRSSGTGVPGQPG